MPHYVVRRVTAALNRDRKAVNGSRIVALGVSYKPNVGDTRQTPATAIIEQLSALGAEVTAVDAHVEDATTFAGVPLVATAADELLRSCDLVVLLTDHDAVDYDAVIEVAPRVLDTRARLPDDQGVVERL